MVKKRQNDLILYKQYWKFSCNFRRQPEKTQPRLHPDSGMHTSQEDARASRRQKAAEETTTKENETLFQQLSEYDPKWNKGDSNDSNSSWIEDSNDAFYCTDQSAEPATLQDYIEYKASIADNKQIDEESTSKSKKKQK